MTKSANFREYRNDVRRRVKELGDNAFIIETLEQGDIRELYKQGRVLESFYLLGTLDYVSRKNGVPICTDYDDLRCLRIKEPIYPEEMTNRGQRAKTAMRLKAIPELIRFNIVEPEE